MRRFGSLQRFYASDPRRARSVEVAFGSHWRRSRDGGPLLRCVWLEDTGEIVTVQWKPLHGGGHATGAVHVLAAGVFELEQVEELLSGWQRVCGGDGSLDWLIDRARSWVAEPSFAGGR